MCTYTWCVTQGLEVELVNEGDLVDARNDLRLGRRQYAYLRNQAAQWLPNDTLTIVCDVSIVGRHSYSLKLINEPGCPSLCLYGSYAQLVRFS